jgi:hypothetical protein
MKGRKMSKADEPVHPTKISHPNGMTKQYNGLTKREYFAAMAMQGIARDWSNDVTNWRIEKMAKCAVEYADALIAALERKPE